MHYFNTDLRGYSFKQVFIYANEKITFHGVLIFADERTFFTF